MKFLFIAAFLIPSLAWCDDFEQMKSQVLKASLCGAGRNANINETAASIACYDSILSSKLTSREKAKVSLFLGTIKTVKKISLCDVQKRHLELFSASTKNYVCLEFASNLENREISRLVFFEKNKGKFLIYSIYEPFDWN